MHSLIFILKISFILAFTLSSPATSSIHMQANTLGDPREVETFFDGVIAIQLATHHIPGATVSIVKDGKMLFAKGYGFSDLDKRIPVVADKTLFRVASVSKLFTWTAVMQLVERGKLKLDTDVNTYLDFKIPATFEKPITLAHLMSHSPGFEELGIGVFVRTQEEVTPLHDYLANAIPKRVRPPGEVSAYSNYGAALAGYIVERVSGMPFADYVETHIFKPLDMQHSSFRQPLPPKLMTDMSTGYFNSGGRNDARGFEFLPPAPAGALSATAPDMARFMLAHLQEGALGDARILQVETAQLMHRQHFTNDPRVNGFAHGFAEATINNQQIIWHAGDTLYFHSALVLLPDRDTGIFVSFNSSNGDQAVGSSVQAFMNRYFPTPASAQPARLAGSAERVHQITGSYQSTRRNYTTPERIASLFNMVNVQAAGDDKPGELLVSFGMPAQQTTRYIEVEPLDFAPMDDSGSIDGHLLFRVNEHGGVTAFMNANPTQALEKQQWYGTSGLHIEALMGSLLLFLSVLVVSPIAGWVNRRLRSQQQPMPSRIGAWLAIIVSLAGLIFVIAFMVQVMNPEVVYGLPSYFSVLRFVPWVMVVLVIGMLGCAALSWTRGYWGVVRRIYFSLVTLASVVFLWWAWFWNLIW